MKVREIEIDVAVNREQFDHAWSNNSEELCRLATLVDAVFARQKKAMKEILKPLLYCWFGYIVALFVVPFLMGTDGALLVQCIGTGMFAGLIYTTFETSNRLQGESLKSILVTHTINQKIAEQKNEKREHHSDH